MERALYLDCSSGISGDMFVAAMLDLGANKEVLFKALNSIFIEGYEIKISRVHKSGLEASDFLVVLDEKNENHDHNMEYLHGQENHPINKLVHMEYKRRSIEEIEGIIDRADMTKSAKKLAIKIFDILSVAQAKAHGVLMEQVHFYEVGTVDSIVDIVAAAVCFDELGISKTIIPSISDGTGTIRCRHGLLKIPVPAVRNIDEIYQLNLQITTVEGELVTPTGAAIAAAIRTEKELPMRYSIIDIGLGAGKRKYQCSSILKAAIIKEIL